MSQRGNCRDNTCMKNFFNHFKAECFHLYSFRKVTEVKLSMRKYIHFYNHQRFQKKLNNRVYIITELRLLSRTF
ncbi:IS3 family transposase [Bacillus cereus]|uniref:IS3 family transposase n=1 Tax=Bacillus cereus TaxID=1396 RepID=UPI003670E82F